MPLIQGQLQWEAACPECWGARELQPLPGRRLTAAVRRGAAGGVATPQFLAQGPARELLSVFLEWQEVRLKQYLPEV